MKQKNIRNIRHSHVPSWIKGRIIEISAGRRSGTYYHLGVDVGQSMDDFDEDFDQRFSKKDLKSLAVWKSTFQTRGPEQRYFVAEHVNPTRTLKKMFANQPYAKADFLIYIPSRRRSDFLAGLLEGLENR